MFRISNVNGEVSKVGAVIGTKSENRTKDSMTLFQENIVSYFMQEREKFKDYNAKKALKSTNYTNSPFGAEPY